MVVLAVAAQKGGVGKTTVALNLSLAFARRGCRTLLVDTDPQGAIGWSLRGGVHDKSGLAECLRRDETLAQAAVKTRVAELDILPVGQLSPEEVEDWGARLAEAGALADVFSAAIGRYDLLVVDTMSGMTGPTQAVLQVTDRLLVPIQAEPLSLRSIPIVLEAVGRRREANASLALAGFLLTMLQSRQEYSLATAQEAWSHLPTDLVLEAFVPRDPAFLESSAQGVPVGLLRKRPPAVAMVFDQIAEELAPRLGLSTQEDETGPISLLD
jgi:chromosome partitioning protein